MPNNSAIDMPIYVVGQAVYEGNSLLRPWTRAMSPNPSVDRDRLEGGIDTLFAGDAVMASGSPTADYDPATFFDDYPIGILSIGPGVDWDTDFFPPTT